MRAALAQTGSPPMNKHATPATSAAQVEIPVPAGVNAPGFGSDVVAETLRALDIPYIALNPGRELSRPARLPRQLSRQRAAADAALPARGEPRSRSRTATPRSPARRWRAAVHSNVGLMHATMAIFNAWCDRMPIARARRHRPGRCREAPALDRLDPHRARSGRAGARLHQVGRPAGLARPPRARRCCAPPGSRTPRRMGPVYVNLDAGMQEAKLPEPLPPIDVARYRPRSAHRAGSPRW